MFSFKLLLALSFGISYLCIDAKPFNDNVQQEEIVKRFANKVTLLEQRLEKLELQQNPQKIETKHNEQISELKCKIVTLGEDLKQFILNAAEQMILFSNQTKLQQIPGKELRQFELNELKETGDTGRRPHGAIENLQKSFSENRKKMIFEYDITRLEQNMEQLKLNLQQAQQKFEKIKTETNRNQQITDLVIEITELLSNIEWFESRLEDLWVTPDHYLGKNVTNLLQGVLQFKSNLHELKTTIRNYETQLKRGKVNEIQQDVHEPEFVTQITTLKCHLIQKNEEISKPSTDVSRKVDEFAMRLGLG